MNKDVDLKNRERELKELVQKLNALISTNRIFQKGIASAIGCSQEYISRILNSKVARLKGSTMTKLKIYIEEEIEKNKRFQYRLKQHEEGLKTKKLLKEMSKKQIKELEDGIRIRNTTKGLSAGLDLQ